MVIAVPFQLFFTMCVGALILVLAISYLIEVFAQFCLVFGFDLVLGMLELAGVALSAFIFEEISTDAFPL